MPASVKTLIQDCVQEALQLPRDPLAEDVRDLALQVYNTRGRDIFQAWPWDNTKIDEFTAPAAVSGVITFTYEVGEVRGIRSLNTSTDATGERLWNQDELQAATRGVSVESGRFIYLADSATGCRRIRIDAEDTTGVYRVLALKRFVQATVESAYDEDHPELTPTDYRVAVFTIDRAENALREFVKDALRLWAGEAPQNQGQTNLQNALQREQAHQDRERVATPRVPMFQEVGQWW